MRRIWFALLLVCGSGGAQTSFVTTSTVQNSAAYRPGVVIGGIANYQANQYLKNLNFVNGGDMPSAYFDTPLTCASGGPVANDTTHWYASQTYAQGYPANFWAGATYYAYSASTGASLGSGVISSNTTNIPAGSITAWSITSNVVTFTSSNSLTAGQIVTLSNFGTSTFFNGKTITVTSATSTQFVGNFSQADGSATETGTWGQGMTLTLGTALSGACNTTNQDVLLVTLFNASTSLTTPSNIYTFGGSCSGTAWSSDVAPTSTNTIQSLALPNSCSFSYYMDVASHPGTNSSGTIAATNTSWINLNGTYTATFKYKCLTAGTGSIHFSLGRNGGTNYISGTTLTPTCNATAGAGWTTYTQNFTASETGSQATGGLLWNFSATAGQILLQDVQVNENSNVTGNTTPFRDAYVCLLKNLTGCPTTGTPALNPGSLRFMDGSDWCSYIPDMIGTEGNNRWCSFSEYGPFSANVPVGYAGKLGLCLLVNADCWLTVGPYNTPANYATLVTWLSTQGYLSSFSAAGLHIRIEPGNEQWNFGSQGQLYNGDGLVYGTRLGQIVAAIKGASGYNSSVIKIVGNGWIAQCTSSSPGQWCANVLTNAALTTNGTPDEMDIATYMMNYLGSFTASGSNVATTGAPFLDAFAEDTNFNIASPTGGFSVLNIASNLLNNFSVGTAVYEANWGAFLFGQGATTTQLQRNQMEASVGEALANQMNYMLMQRDSKITGPINTFVMQQDITGSTVSPGNPAWGIIRTDACGPAQTSCTDSGRPDYIIQQLYNTALGSNTKLMQTSQSGTPTYSQANSQSVNCPGSSCYQVWANSAVPKVQCSAYSNGSTNWTTICFNNDLVNAQSVTISGPGTPSTSVTQWVFPGSSNIITDNNENTYIGSGSIAPVVTLPSSTSTSGATYSIPAASMMALTYSTASANAPWTIFGPITIIGSSGMKIQ